MAESIRISSPTGGLIDDCVQPYMIDRTGLHGRMVKLGPSVDAILGRHAYPEPVATLLAEVLALTAGLAAALKFNGIFTLQTTGDGPVPILVADVTSTGHMRGFAQVKGAVPAVEDIGSAPVLRLLGEGYLAFTVDQGQYTERYQGIVALEGGTLEECVHRYFEQSEQFASAIKLALGRRAVTLMASAKAEEMLDPALMPNDLLYRLFHEDGVRVFTPRPIADQCRCSRERIFSVLKSLETDALDDGRIEVTCEFCSRSEVFSDTDLAAARK